MTGWHRPLAELLPELRRQAMAKAGEPAGPRAEAEARAQGVDWAWVVLQRGALVAVRVRAENGMRTEIRLARQGPLEDAAAWAREVAVFREHLGIRIPEPGRYAPESRGWYAALPVAQDAHEARFIELRVGEVRPGIGLCGVCGEEAGWKGAFAPNGLRCSKHAALVERS